MRPVNVTISTNPRHAADAARALQMLQGKILVLPRDAEIEIISPPNYALAIHNEPFEPKPTGAWPHGRMLTIDELRVLDAATPYELMTKKTRAASYLLFPERLDAA